MRFCMCLKKGLPVLLLAFFFITSASAGTAVLEEDFEGAFPPPGWSAVDDSVPPLDCAWKKSDQYTLDGLDSPSPGAAADSDSCAPDDTPAGDVDTSLVTPELDLTGLSDTVLSFDFAYRHHFSGSVDLDASTDGGNNWTTLTTYDFSPPFPPFVPQVEVIDLSAYDGEAGVILRWRYTAGNGFWVFVDNVLVGPAGPGVLETDPPSLDFGDVHTGILSTLEVSVSNAGNPGDASIELDAIELTGDTEFQIAGGNCEAGVTELAPGDVCILRVSFVSSDPGTFTGQLEVSGAGGHGAMVPLTGTAIPTSAIEVDPEALSAILEIGQTDDRTISISNAGTAALDWEIPLIHDLSGLPGVAGIGDLLRQGVLLVHNVGRNSIVALDPESGDVIDPDFVLTGDLGFGAKPKVLMHPDGERLLLTHQTDNIVHAFDTAGGYLGVFAPAGGEDTNIMQNIRGMALHPDTGNLLVASAPFSGAPHALVEFDLEGNYLGEFIDMGANGLDNPWSIAFRETDLLLSAGNGIHAFGHDGTHIGPFNDTPMNFVQQIIEIGNGNVLAANSQGGVWEFDADGTHVDNHAQFEGVSGVHQLPGDNLLITANTGLHEIDMQGNIIRDILGGAAAMFSLVKAVDCTVPEWLSIAPTSGSVPVGGPADEVVVTFDAAGLDPGVHEDVICIESNDPVQPRFQVPVTLTVEQPADHAIIEGTVESAGYCGADPSPLEGATVHAVGGGGAAVTRTTDENGFYQLFMPESASPVDITVSASGHLDDMTTGVPISAGQTVTENFELALDAPCITVAEDSYHFDVLLGDDATDSLTIGNIEGAASLEWAIGEGPGLAAQPDPRAHFPAQRRPVAHKHDPNVSTGPSPWPPESPREGGFGVRGGFEVPAYSTTGNSTAPGYITMDARVPASLTVIRADQPTRFYAATFIRNDFDNHYMLAAAGGTSALNTFGSTDTASGNFTPLGTVSGAPAVTSWNSMKWDHATGTLYAVANVDELYTIDPVRLEATLVGTISGPGVNPDGAVVVSIAISPDGLMYALDLVDDVLLAVDKTTAEAAVIGPVGLDANFAQDMDFDQTTGILYWAAFTDSNFSHMYTLDLETGEGTLIGDIQGRVELQSFTIARPGGGCSTPEDISWLSVSDASGTTAAHDSDEVDVMVDTSGLAHGSYEAFLCIASNDPVDGLVRVPVTLDVTDLNAGFLEGTVTGAGRCGLDPQPLRDATVSVTGVNGSFEATTDDDGFYSIPINAGEGPVDIAVSAGGHLDTSVTGIAIEAGVTTTQDVALMLEAPCFTVEPGSLEAEAGPDGVTSRTLTIGNTDGNANLDWTLDMAGPASLPPTALQNAGNVPAGNASLTRGAGTLTEAAGDPVPLGDMQMSQTGDTNIVPQNSVGCPVGPNHLLRRFYFHEHPGVGNRINSVDVAIQETTGSTALTVNLYALPSSTPVDTLPPDSLELIGAAAVPVSAADDGTILNVPVTGTVSDIEAFDLVVEVVSSGAFYIGATDSGETHPGFAVAPWCGINEPTRIDQLEGFETTHIIQVVNISSGGGCAPPEDVPWLSVDPDAGTTAASGAGEVTVNFDAAGLDTGDHEALLCVNSNDTGNPRIEVPVTLTVLDQSPAELAVDPGALNYGQVAIGATATMSFDVLNVADAGAADLSLTAITAGGDARFSISGGTCAVGVQIEPGGSCTVEVVFAPDTEGSFSGEVTVEGDNQAATVPLSGAGVEPAEVIFSDRFEIGGGED